MTPMTKSNDDVNVDYDNSNDATAADYMTML